MAAAKKQRVKIPTEIAHLPTRVAEAKGLTFIVPQGIVRIDIEKGYAGTHGWQVRHPKYSGGSSKFFSDTGELRYIGPVESLRMAVEYLAQHPPVAHVRRYPNAKPSSTTGIPGIRLVLMQKKYRSVIEVYIEASSIEKGRSARRFYCGTDNTATEDRIQAAIERAVQFREEARVALLNRRKSNLRPLAAKFEQERALR